MRRLIIQGCFADGVQSHELLGGDSERKRKFANTDRPHVTL